jgi:hypothetical protein
MIGLCEPLWHLRVFLIRPPINRSLDILFLKRFALPGEVSRCSLRSVQLKLIKIGARIVAHARRVVFQMAEVTVSGGLFSEFLARIRQLAAVPT